MQESLGKSTPKLIPFRLESPRGKHLIKVSESTTGGVIISHIQSKFPRSGKNSSLFIFVTYKGNVYPLNREITAKFILEQYRDSQDGAVHLQLKEEDVYG